MTSLLAPPVSALMLRLRRWWQLVAEFTVNHGMAQAAGMISGLIYVRMMPVDEYALYALSLGMLGFMSVGSDLGLTGSLSYFWRESAKGGQPIAPKIAAIRQLRFVLLAIVVVAAALMFATSAVRVSWSWIAVLACFLLVVATAGSQVYTVLELQLMRLAGGQRQSYYCEAAGSVTRLAAAVAMLATGLGSAWFGLAGGLAGVIVMLATVHWLRQPALTSLGRDTAVPAIDLATWREVRRYLLPVMPGVLVYMLTDPLILWLTARYAGTVVLSEMFAAGRIGAVLALLGQFVIVVVTPRLAGIGNDRHFIRMLALAAMAVAVLGAAMIAVAWVMPWLPLLLIGPNYAHLGHEILIVAAMSSVGVLSMLLILSNRLRGWVRLDPVVALVQLAILLMLAFSWSYGSAASVLTLSLVLSVSNLALAAAITSLGLVRPSMVRTAAA